MTEFFGSIWWLLVSLGLLVTFHEFGHYWVARRCGVRVLRFSVGFGRPLWTHVGRNGTEYVVALLPLGGYVKMLDEREVEVAPHERHESFNAKTVWQRIAIVAAGPLANLLLCIGLLWLMFVIGKPDFVPEIGRVNGIAAEAGFRAGDRLLSVGGRETPSWTDAGIALATASIDGVRTEIRVRSADGSESLRVLPLDLADLPAGKAAKLSDLGIEPMHWMIPPIVGTVSLGAAAENGLRPGDRILAVGDEPIVWYDDLGPLVQKQAKSGEALPIRVLRDGIETTVRIDPTLSSDDGPQRWILGVMPDHREPGKAAMLRFGLVAAVPAALEETFSKGSEALGMLRRLVTGQASLENISGPVTIARVANGSASLGPAWFLNFLAVLSLSLCIMNLLPIPVLDGGHLLYYLIELVKGSPVGERVLVAGQYVGLVFLAGLMGLAFYNDLFRPGF